MAKLSKGAKIGLALVGVSLVIAAAGSGGGSQQIVWANFAPPQGKPPLPTQGDGFRTGMMPDPAAPNDPNRGRAFQQLGHSNDKTRTVSHDVEILRIDADTDGTIIVDVWAQLAMDPARCASWRVRVVLEGGRIKSVGQTTANDAPPCPAGSKKLAGSLPGDQGTLVLPQIEMELRPGGQLATVVMVWTTRVFVPAYENKQGRAISFYVDAIWRFTPA